MIVNNYTFFIITNGRSTFNYCFQSTKEQTDNIVILKDMSLHQALKKCLKCDTPYFCKIDDDFILHPNALQYMISTHQKTITTLRYNPKVKSPKNSKQKITEQTQAYHKDIGIYFCRLWEDYTNTTRGSIKIYNTDVIKSINGFHAHPQTGKVDSTTNLQLFKNQYAIIRDSSIVGIHACGTVKEHCQYQVLWNQMSKKSWTKERDEYVKIYNKTLDEQYNLRTNFIDDLNKNESTSFYEFVFKQ